MLTLIKKKCIKFYHAIQNDTFLSVLFPMWSLDFVALFPITLFVLVFVMLLHFYVNVNKLIIITPSISQHQGDWKQREGRRHQMADLLGHLRFLLSPRILLRHLSLLDSILQPFQSMLFVCLFFCVTSIDSIAIFPQWKAWSLTGSRENSCTMCAFRK